MDYSQRRLSDVGLYGLDAGPIEEGFAVYANVDITFSNRDGEDDGPRISVSVSVLAPTDDLKIAEAERLVLDGVSALLNRAAKENGEALHHALAQSRERFRQQP